MAGITTAVCTSFKAELAQGLHNFTTTTGNVFKCALITATPTGTWDSTTTNYGAGSGAPTAANLGTDEVSGTGYTAGGFAWTAAQNITPATSGTSAFWSWSVNPTWPSATFSTGGCMIYNTTNGNRTCAIFSFGGTQTTTAGTFTVTLPANGAGTSVLQLN